MYMVIFGAGASYDSAPDYPPPQHDRGLYQFANRPPLATELFLNDGVFRSALEQFPECDPIIPYMRTIPKGETFEHRLDTLQTESESDPQRVCQLSAIRHYLQYAISLCDNDWHYKTCQRITNYVTLIDQLRRCRDSSDPILLVTFNYDRMIENALTSVNINIFEIADYVKDDRFKLYKLHGSVNWGREVETPILLAQERNALEIAHELIARASDLVISDRYVVSRSIPIRSHNENALFPAIAIPVETKRDFECPTAHLDGLLTYMEKVTKLITIGWRASEQHFLKLMHENLSDEIQVQAVAGNKESAEETLNQFRKAGIKIVGTAVDGGFTEYVASREAERFFGT